MRLLRWKNDNEFSVSGNLDEDDLPPYAILSHTWGFEQDEVKYADLQQEQGQYHNKIGYEKIRFCGEQARKDNLQHFWVDTCCINKADLAELAEAITSMYRWYRNAKKCYVYLSDMSEDQNGNQKDRSSRWESNLRTSRWFTRGWTLQELLAPAVVEFFSRDRTFLGTKQSLAEQISAITTIPLAALYGTPPTQFSIAERWRWAHGRQTKKAEDKAYCLLGIFDVFMPLIYGEGEHAFRRLEEEVNKRVGANENAHVRPGMEIGSSSGVPISNMHSIRSLGLCLTSAPVIKSSDFIGRLAEINTVHRILHSDTANLE